MPSNNLFSRRHVVGHFLAAIFAFPILAFASEDSGACKPMTSEATSKKSSIEDDARNIQGSWTATSWTFSGRELPIADLPAEERSFLSASFQGNRWMIRREGKSAEEFTRFELLPDKQPKQIKMQVNEADGVALGIYRLEGDTLTICMRVDEKADTPPVGFLPLRGSHEVLLIYHRDGGQEPPKPEVAAPGVDPRIPVEPKPIAEARGPSAPPRLPDVVAADLAKLTIAQLKALSVVYQGAFDAKINADRQAMERESAARVRNEVTYELNLGLLNVRVRKRPREMADAAKARQDDVAELESVNELVRLSNNLTLIRIAILNEITADDGK